MKETRTLIYALFNKKNREFSAWSNDISQFPEKVRETMLYKEIDLEEYGVTDAMFNPERYRWIGDYDSGKFTDLLASNKAVVTEKEVNEKYDSLFFRKYSVKDVLYQLILNLSMNTEEGKKMQDFLKTLLNRKEKDVEYYKTSGVHIYETVEDQRERQKNAFQK
jgi:hypothetical protein